MLHLISIALAGSGVLVSAAAAGYLIYPRVPLPFAVRMTSGAALLSGLIFLVLLAGWGKLPVFIGIGLLLCLSAFYVRPACASAELRMNRFFGAVFLAYGLLYLIYVAAPEIQPDAVTYHLGLVSEYVRLESFPDRVGFYEMLPRGVDMLFVPAFAIAGPGGAKAVHFGFLLALVPLLRALAKELGLPDERANTAAARSFRWCRQNRRAECLEAQEHQGRFAGGGAPDECRSAGRRVVRHSSGLAPLGLEPHFDASIAFAPGLIGKQMGAPIRSARERNCFGLWF